MKPKKPTPRPRKFRVYVEQVNQTYVEVSATDREEAEEKGYRLWRREYAHSRVRAVEEQP